MAKELRIGVENKVKVNEGMICVLCVRSKLQLNE